MANVKKVCVIGAGVSGLSAIKSCLEEGFQPTCYEQHDDLGGIWYYTEDPRPNQGAAMFKSVVSNISKSMLSYSDFPFPEDAPMYPSHERVHQYLREYADHFNLLPHIRFGTQVIKVEEAKDHVTSGQWMVHTSGNGGKHETFDAVILSNGSAFGRPVSPDVPGYETFKGVKLHSYQYRTNKPFEGKRVLIVGSGNTAFDLAVDVCRVATQVDLALLKGTWVVPRLHKKGTPIDLHAFRRVYSDIPVSWLNGIFKDFSNNRFDHDKYGVAGRQQPITQSTPTINDDIGLCLASRKVSIKPQLVKLFGTSARFADGTTVGDVDAVIFATGYVNSCSFLDHELEADIKKLDLYKLVFPTRLAHPTLALVGAGQSNGPLFPLMELQARWAARVFKGVHKLPNSDTMKANTEVYKDMVLATFGRLKPVTNNVVYRDDIAAEIGAKPNLLWLIIKDPLLAYMYYFGPAYPFHHRLVGPNPWKGAAAASKHAYYNTLSGVATSFTPKDSGSVWLHTKMMFTCVIIGVICALVIITRL
ncbi:dimethylaniline monooxygenase [N-oxide-forming] 2-like [Branchiostoma floridae]|uniref:Flavin-containing monooxygenase n=1 Tax=Branchiostoma floridae TaxID=7739 RepID=A0A9J7KS24_BRAFL|nr:dimethylaniline monooxygenase [N-oxide-forming] 2-like [Branchiostoma floridae]